MQPKTYPTDHMLRGALIGCGHISIHHLRAWAQVKGVKIVALANRTKNKAEERAREFGIPIEHVYSDYRELLRNEVLDFVDIATAPDIHRMQVEDAAAHGVNVFCQKPFAPSLEDALHMMRSCNEAGVLFAINDNWRWRSWYRDLKRYLQQGIIGSPHYMRIEKHNDLTLPLPDGSLPQVFINQSYMLTMEKLIVFEWGIHLIDVMRFLFGEVKNIYARMDHVSPICSGEDRAIINLEVGSINGLIDISWASVNGEKRASQLEQVTLEGDVGTIELIPDRQDLLKISKKEGTHQKPAFDCTPEEAYQASYNAAQRHFAECLRNGRLPETVAEDNYRTLQATFAAYESAAGNKVVFLEK
ncbi:MAG: Gfo/Idh/MocA family oxidoreductase [Anaerolineales bacterium]|nr:Gfo/Idh/MocA family oxidoreductase [Anaerolineales bacterium]